jgi:vacuolar-type H+-ATPase subunit H
MSPPADDNSVSLRQYIDLLITDNKEALKIVSESNVLANRLVAEAIELRFKAIDDSTELARENLNMKLESMNELRRQMDQMTGTYITRIELESKLLALITASGALETRLQTMEKKAANLDGKFWMFGASITFIVTIISIALHFIH